MKRRATNAKPTAGGRQRRRPRQGDEGEASTRRPLRFWQADFPGPFPALFLSLAMCAVAVALWPILCKLGVRACCFADLPGLREAMSEALPGGLMRWFAGFLSVLWATPWRGGAVFLALGFGVTLAGRRWARLGPLVSALPFAVVLGQVAYCGFSVWLFADAAFPVLYLLGWGTLFLVLGMARRWGGWAATVLAALYPLCGAPAFLGGVAAAALPGLRPCARAAWAVTAAVLPVAWQRLSPFDPAWGALLQANAPVLLEEGAHMWDAASAALFLALVLAPRMPGLLRRVRGPAASPRRLPAGLRAAACGVGPAALFLLAVFCVMDPVHPLYDLLACERALAAGDMGRILAVPDARVAAHRMLAAYRIHALWRVGQLEERLFDVPWQVSHDATTIDTMAFDGYGLLYDYGIVQLARRWCYESVVNLGWSAPKLSLLARIAVVCGEPALARRYALQLRRIPLRRTEADALLALAEGNGTPDADLRRVDNLHRRLCFDAGSPVFEGDKRLEPGIYNRYAVLKNGDRDMVALYLCASLLRKELTPFIENYDVILRVWPRRPLPRAFQQGLLAAASTLPPSEQPRLTSDLFGPGIPQAFADFRRLSANVNPNDPAFRRRFASTFWFYAAFVP